MLYKVRDEITKDYDVVIIGSGLAGMTAANVLGRHGHSVLLLESHNKLGGFATWFYRHDRNHVFDISLHGFPVGMIKSCRKYWNKEIADSIVQLKDVRFVNPQFNVQTTFTKEHYTETMVEKFGVAKETVEAFFKHLAEMNFYDNSQMTNRELFEKFFPGRNDVTRFLMEPITYANGSTLDDPAITYGIVFSNFMSKGVYTFTGGTDHLINRMKEELLKNNVDIKLQTKVEKIQIENGKAQGVYVNGKLVKAKAVLSNGNIRSTVLNLVGEEHFPADYVEKTKAIRLNSSSCQVYMGLKEGATIPYIGELVFTSTHPTYEPARLLDLKVSSRTFSVYYQEERRPRIAIVSSTNCHYEDWKKLSKEEYEKEKEFMIEETIKGLEAFIPDIREKLEVVEAATPVTVERYTLHPKGSSFGTKFEGLDVSMNLHKTIPGLFHAGSVGIIMSGWLGAANYGAIQVNAIESYLGAQNVSV
ncbi:phytoene desaturase family protein [Peredibacter starrii]|uniref:FAD-dependent oxidoreductase n=1 Tax=Peredibacter starrii TaxID=28202 RepID=A0AAX4HJE8_9BACT|nr:FAD-dependent oxidoreductase [Peredibacter starrii]WPU63351.1 FAD-dependent oxidoreductase [Peredibacter starrii]